MALTLTSRGRHLDCHTNAANVTSFTSCHSQHNHNLSLLLLSNVKLWSTFYCTWVWIRQKITNFSCALSAWWLMVCWACCLERWAARVYNLEANDNARGWFIKLSYPKHPAHYDFRQRHPASRERITFTTSTCRWFLSIPLIMMTWYLSFK